MASTLTYTLSLHDALPISGASQVVAERPGDVGHQRFCFGLQHSRNARLGECGDGEGLPVGVLDDRSEEHTSELQSRRDLVCRLLLEKKKQTKKVLVTQHIQ